jgi:hypothetical protein
MNERELERAIDAAARAMMAREPGRSLGYTVMARVRDEHAPERRPYVWATAAASLVVGGAIAMTLVRETPTTLPLLPRAAQLTVGQPAVIPNASIALTAATPRPAIHVVRGVDTRAPVSIGDVSPIEPIQTVPIVLSSIDVPQLERETTAIDALNVEPLTIEPLAASND